MKETTGPLKEPETVTRRNFVADVAVPRPDLDEFDESVHTPMDTDIMPLAVVFDLDETLGYFGLFSTSESIMEHCMARFAWRPDSRAPNEMLKEAFSKGEGLRHGVVAFLADVLRLRDEGRVAEISIFTRNSRRWTNRVVDALGSCLGTEKIFDKIISREDSWAFTERGEKDLRSVYPSHQVVFFDDRPLDICFDVTIHTIVPVSPWISIPSLEETLDLFSRHIICVPAQVLQAVAFRARVRDLDLLLEPFHDAIRKAWEDDARRARLVQLRNAAASDRRSLQVWNNILEAHLAPPSEIETSSLVRPSSTLPRPSPTPSMKTAATAAAYFDDDEEEKCEDTPELVTVFA